MARLNKFIGIALSGCLLGAAVVGCDALPFPLPFPTGIDLPESEQKVTLLRVKSPANDGAIEIGYSDIDGWHVARALATPEDPPVEANFVDEAGVPRQFLDLDVINEILGQTSSVSFNGQSATGGMFSGINATGQGFTGNTAEDAEFTAAAAQGAAFAASLALSQLVPVTCDFSRLCNLAGEEVGEEAQSQCEEVLGNGTLLVPAILANLTCLAADYFICLGEYFQMQGQFETIEMRQFEEIDSCSPELNALLSEVNRTGFEIPENLFDDL